MHKYIIDANCLISFVTDRSLLQQKKIAPYFARAADFKCTIAIAGTTVAEFVYVLDKVYRRSSDEISILIRSLIATPGFDVFEQFDVSALLHIWPERVADFGDAAIAAAAVVGRYTVLTFDRSFGKDLEKLHIPHLVL
jgi:predicted nucleic-acid-binding protein